MRFSVWPDQQRPWAEVAAIVDHAERTGWDGAYVYDHFMPHDPTGEPRAGAVLEGWTTLTALAARTSRLRIGPLVLGSLYRHPAVVASMAATLDQISGGRLVLGLGAGWQANEHAAYGIGLPPPGPRLDQFTEACEVVVSLLRTERTTYSGAYYQLTDAPCEPKPLQRRLPVLIGGSGERRTIPLAARLADEWNAWTTLESFSAKSAVLDRRCEEHGRDPASVRRSTQAVVELVDRGAARPETDEQTLAGTPAEVVDVLGRYRDAGLDEFIVPDHHAVPLQRRLDELDRFRAEVAEPLG